jgi:hypothetical protein
MVLGGCDPEIGALCGCEALCGFPSALSSFLHIRHLGAHGWIFEVVGLEGGATQKLQDSTGFSVCKEECQKRMAGCFVRQYPVLVI